MSTYTSTDKPTGTETATLLEKIKRQIKESGDAFSKQRIREREDLSWQVSENQWTDAAKAERKGGTIGNQQTPPRPMLSVSITQQPAQLIKNQAEAADLGVSVHPVSEKADKEMAEVMEGLYSRVQRDSNAEQVRLWAFDRAVQCGMGWYMVNTRYDEDGDHPDDQEIVIQRILDQGAVYIDPAAQEADFSDAEYGGILVWMKRDKFKREFPDADHEQYDSADAGGSFGADIQEREPEWVKLDPDGGMTILVAWHFYKEHEYQKKGSRTIDNVLVKSCKVTGIEVVEEQDWNGHLIPLIPVPGRELQPFDGQRRWEGLVRPARDPQQVFNYAISAAVEDVGRLSKVPYVGAAGAFTGFETQWQQANRRNFPYLEYNTIDSGGKPIQPPTPMQIDGNKLGLSLQLVEMAKSWGQVATAIYDQTLGDAGAKHESGRRTLALQQQADASTSNYLQNLANISMRYEARVFFDLAPTIYGDRTGRVTTVLGLDDEERQVMLGQRFAMGSDGRPKPATPNAAGAKLYDFAKGGKYSLAISVGKAYQTRLQEGQEALGQMLPNLPPELQILILPTYMKYQDTPGSQEVADIMEKYRDSKFKGLVGDKGNQPTPEQLQAQLAGQSQQMQQMGQQLQMAMQKLETESAKQAATMAKAQLDAQVKMAELEKEIELQRMKGATSIRVAEINALAKGVQSADAAQVEQIALAQEHAFDAHQAELDRAHEVGMAAAGGNTMTMRREGGQETGQEQGQEESTEPPLPPAAEAAEETGE